MLSIENTQIYGWEAAIRGMRNPKNSWAKSDTVPGTPRVGPNDLKLMRTLAKAGPDHGKFLRMITVTMDITAPLYWYKEFDTYKIGTVANSCSTMHKIHSRDLTVDDFSSEHLCGLALASLSSTISVINQYRKLFLRDNDKVYWWQMIQLLPSSYNQRRTVQLNYAVLKTMYHARKNHKLDEWRVFCGWIETLPYAELITDV